MNSYFRILALLNEVINTKSFGTHFFIISILPHSSYSVDSFVNWSICKSTVKIYQVLLCILKTWLTKFLQKTFIFIFFPIKIKLYVKLAKFLNCFDLCLRGITQVLEFCPWGISRGAKRLWLDLCPWGITQVLALCPRGTK